MQGILDRTDEMEDLQWYLGSMVRCRASLPEPASILMKEQDMEYLLEVTNSDVEESTLSLRNWKLPSSVTGVLGVKRPHSPPMHEVQSDQKLNATTSTIEKYPNLITIQKMFH